MLYAKTMKQSNIKDIEEINAHCADRITSCYFEKVARLNIGKNCKPGVFQECHFEHCNFFMHPKGPQMDAFHHCTFADSCSFVVTEEAG